MQGLLLALLFFFMFSQALAAVPAGATNPIPAQAEAQAESKAMASASASNTPPPKAPPEGTVTGGSGYFELVAGTGPARLTVGKSPIGVSATETDWMAQQNSNWQYPFSRIGIGYVYYLVDFKRGFTDQLIWFPSVEPMFNLTYFNLTATGRVLQFKNPALGRSSFALPIQTTDAVIDAIVTIAAYKRSTFFVFGGLGEAWSKVDYHDTPNQIVPISRPSLVLTTHRSWNGMYEWGAGITYAFNTRIALDLEYLYTHVGNMRTSGNGTLGGVLDPQISSAAFDLRTQALLLDLHVALA